MKIAELEAHHDAYMDSERTICTMVENREFPAVFSICVESFPHIISAISFRKKRSITPETPDLLAFATICRYAPPLFEHAAIESLFAFVKSTRALAQHENDYLCSIEGARKREQLAYSLWNHLEEKPGMLHCDIGAKLMAAPEDVEEIVELWEDLGVIVRRPEDGTFRLYFRTRLNAEVEGLCLNCGARGKGRKELFYKPAMCQKCNTEGYYHIEYPGLQ